MPRYESAFCPYVYGYPVDHLIRGLKYSQAMSHGRILGTLLGAQLKLRPRLIWPECFVPVPLSARRYRERGYNQVIEIGSFVERVTAVRMRTDLVKRVRHTEDQVGLSKKARRKNIRGAFEVVSDVPRRVAVLDDVITTGSTVEEMTRASIRAGAAHVEVWAVARAS
jgi:ComF family protein